MPLFDRVKAKRKARKEELLQDIERLDKIRENKQKQRIKTLEKTATIAKNLPDKTINRNLNIGTGICPIFQKSIELETKETGPEYEPFGWPKGTVRGILTFWVVIGFFLLTAVILIKIPLTPIQVLRMWEVLAIVFGLVVGSYFYSRMKMGSGGLFGGRFL